MNHQSFINNITDTLTIYLKDIDKQIKTDTINNIALIKSKDEKISSLIKKNNDKDLVIESLSNNIDTLTEEIIAFTKVSLLKTAHKNYDKISRRNDILLKQLEKYKKEIKNLKTTDSKIDKIITIKVEEINETNNSIDLIDNYNIKKGEEKVGLQKALKVLEESKELTNSEKSEDSEEAEGSEESDEIELELFKINRRFYYATPPENDIRDIYKALKIKKGEYDVGDFIGVYKNNTLIKE